MKEVINMRRRFMYLGIGTALALSLSACASDKQSTADTSAVAEKTQEDVKDSETADKTGDSEQKDTEAEEEETSEKGKTGRDGTQGEDGKKEKSSSDSEQGQDTEEPDLYIMGDGDSQPGDPGAGNMPRGDGEMPDFSDGEMPEMPEMPDGQMPDFSGEDRPTPPDWNGEMPEMPDGEMPDMNGERPEMPDGGMGPGGQRPDGGLGQGGQRPDGSQGGQGGPGGMPGGNSASSVSYSATEEITSAKEVFNQNYTSDTADVSALIVNTDEAVTLDSITVNKSGSSDGGDSCNFYGLNAAVLVMGGSTTTITGADITSDADGANGVFCYGGNGGSNGAAGDGTKVIISDSTITTTGNGSGGIMTTGGGIMEANNLTVNTSGRSSAAIRTDRGGGTVSVTGGSYTSNGLGSPAIYSTADITVSDATLTSNLSEGVCIEGKNAVTLNNCDLTANNTQRNGNATFLDTIMIYQSMSGDADSGTSSFTMNGGSLTSKSGHVFHVTNTNAVITLKSVDIVNEDDEDVLISVCDDGWSGAGNTATLIAIDQELSGAVLVGDNSTLTLRLENSAFTGSISGNITNAAGDTVSTSAGNVSVILDDNSTWILTADSYITSFEGNADNIDTNGYTVYLNGEAM